MNLQFKHAVHLCGKDYRLGVHNVPEAVLKDDHFKKYMELGWIVEPPAEALIEPLHVRQARLAAKINAQLPSKKIAADPIKDSDEIKAPVVTKKKR